MKRRLLDSRKLFTSIIMLMVFGVVIHLVFLFDPDSGGLVPDTMAAHRLLNSLGFSLLILGVLSETTTLIGVDFYEEGPDQVRFAHYRNIISFKFVIFLLGLTCILAALLIDRSAIVRDNWEIFEVIRAAVGILAGVILVIQILRSFYKLVSNRADYLDIHRGAIVWYDNEVGSVLEVKAENLRAIRTIFEDSQDTPDVEKFELTDMAGNRLVINLSTMSLLPQGRKIREIFKLYFPGNTDLDNP